MPDTRQEYIEATRRFFRLLEQRDMDGWVDMYADDAENHFPFNFSFGKPEDVIGKEAIRQNWRDFPHWFESVSLPADAVFVDEAERTVVVLADSHNVARMVPDNPWCSGGPLYENRFVFILQFDEDGKVTDFYEYYNALVTGVSSGTIDVTFRDASAPRDEAGALKPA